MKYLWQDEEAALLLADKRRARLRAAVEISAAMESASRTAESFHASSAVECSGVQVCLCTNARDLSNVSTSAKRDYPST